MGTRSSTFGQQVRALRLAGGWTQAELAERSGLSERTVSDLERGLRSTAYPSTARRLAAALGVGPDDLGTFLSDARGPADAEGPAVAAVLLGAGRRARLPRPLTRLIGRESEVGSVLRAVCDPQTRLVTLVGIGGIGKTRLALEVATRAQPAFAGGIYFVELSAVDDPTMVLPAIATAAGLPQAVDDLPLALGRILRIGRVLLVLDTLEHVLASAPAIAGLLEANGQLSVLATSRTPLHLRGEQEVPVLPLPVRQGEVGSRSPAVELFVERATAVLPGFDGGPAALGIVADIAARLDGVPLAIELAAARVKHLSLADVRKNLEHRLEPLRAGARDLPERQRTMRTTHDWSYALLGPAEMRLFRSLAVFRGGFTRDAAAAVLGPSSPGEPVDVIEPLGVLVDSSLVFRAPGATEETRYRLLDVTREYAAERSTAAGELAAARQRHLEHFLTYAEVAEPELRGSDQRRWQARLLADEGNFRAALTWALEIRKGDVALRLAGALWMFWRQAALFAEGRAWLDAALDAAADCPVDVRCRGLWGAGWLAFHAGAYERTAERGAELLQLLAGRADDLHRRNALTLIGSAALADGRNEDAIAAYEQALAICASAGTGWHLATSKLNLGTAKRQAGALSGAAAVLGQALAIYEDLGDRHFTARVLVQLGFVALLEGHLPDAGRELERAMGIFAELGDGWAIAEGLEAIAILRSERDPHSAALLGGAAQRLREHIAALPHPSDARMATAAFARARSGRTAAIFDESWTRGRNIPLTDAIRLALKTDPTHEGEITPESEL